MTTARAPLRTRVRLRPGCAVLRRDQETLQVGLVPPLAVRLPDRPAVRALLAALADGTQPPDPVDPDDPDIARPLAALRSAGLLTEQPYDATPVPDADLALFGPDAARRRAARTGARIGVAGDLAVLPGLDDLLGAAGLMREDDRASVWLLATAGPAPRDALDAWMRAGTPYLVLDGSPGTRRLGPFVEPGRTACRRCVDAHETHTDPRLPLLIEQASAAAVHHPVPVDPVLARLAGAWAVRDLARYVEGDQPSTWSTTVDLDAAGPPVVTPWHRHPHCGCAWDTIL